MDDRLKKFKIDFPSNWFDISDENPDGPPTYIDGDLDEPGVLQISFAEYLNGVKPTATDYDLIELSESIGLKNNFGKVQDRQSGNCRFGKYGLVQFSGSDFPYISVWHLTNGWDFIFVTFICSKYPEQKEINEVEGIVASIRKRRFTRDL